MDWIGGTGVREYVEEALGVDYGDAEVVVVGDPGFEAGKEWVEEGGESDAHVRLYEKLVVGEGVYYGGVDLVW